MANQKLMANPGFPSFFMRSMHCMSLHERRLTFSASEGANLMHCFLIDLNTMRAFFGFLVKGFFLSMGCWLTYTLDQVEHVPWGSE